MNLMSFVILSGCLALGACAPAAKSTSPAEPVQGKVTAPVAVEAQLGDSTARVTVRFQAPATDVRVSVHGVDGLVVTSTPTLVEGATFDEAAATSFDVTFSPGAGRSHLVVAVAGSFQGSPMSRVASFAVGKATAEQQKGSDTVITDSNGQRIKLMPGNGQ